MFRDKEEELARLEELLEEDASKEEAPEEDDETDFLEAPSGDTSEYRNFANDYGNINAYNSDNTDVDLASFSDEVYTPTEQKNTGLLIAAAALLGGILLVLIWWAIRFVGVM